MKPAPDYDEIRRRIDAARTDEDDATEPTTDETVDQVARRMFGGGDLADIGARMYGASDLAETAARMFRH